MICPQCYQFLEPERLAKRRVKNIGEIELEYDIFCPSCNIKVGHVFWGEVVPNNPVIPPRPVTDGIREDTGTGQAAPRRPDTGHNQDRKQQTAPREPEALRYAPGDRRGADRRSGADRRVRQVLWLGPERRLSGEDRRKQQRRNGQDRRKEAGLQDRRMNRQGFPYNRRSSMRDRRKTRNESLVNRMV